MSKHLLQADGRPIEYVPVIKWKEWTFPIRVLNEKIIESAEPKPLIGAVLVQLSDKDNLLWAGLMTLASDIYARDPSGQTQFLDFVSAMGLHLTDGRGNKIDVEAELRQVLNKN